MPVSQPVSYSTDVYRNLARQYESNQPAKALFLWQVVEKLNPEDVTAKERVVQLKQTIRMQSDVHFSKAMEYLKHKAFSAARSELILALAYNPQRKEAAHYLSRLSYEDEFVEYEVRAGDTPERIAQTVYRDGSKQAVVAYFADLSKDEPLRPGRTLRLPAPENEIKARVVNLPRTYSRSRVVPKAYDKAGAEAHYSKGMAYYLAQQFEESIKEWEETLRLNPEHPNARRDIRKARAILRKTELK